MGRKTYVGNLASTAAQADLEQPATAALHGKEVEGRDLTANEARPRTGGGRYWAAPRIGD